MGRYDRKQTRACSNCKYFRLSCKIQDKMRCDYPDNVSPGRFGTLYMKSPEHKNYGGVCENYEEADKQSETV